MEILGLSPVAAALIITLTGITLRTILGMSGKSRKEFNPQLLLVSFVIGFFASVQLVITSLQHIPADADELVILSIVTGEIATVMGIDAGVRSAGKRADAKMRQIAQKLKAEAEGGTP